MPITSSLGGVGIGSNLHHQLQQQSSVSGTSYSEMSEADRKRAHHNALERKRRDHIKDSFHCLRDAIPNIKGEKVFHYIYFINIVTSILIANSFLFLSLHVAKTSRAQILKAATDYIRQMRTRNNDYQNDIDMLKKQNCEIEIQSKFFFFLY